MSQLWPALSIAQREINLKQKINVRMTANDSDSEKAPATTETMTKKDERPPPPVSSKDTDDRHYLCGCKNCICGAAVECPGDICSVCSKYH